MRNSMKKIVRIIATVAAALSIFACTDKYAEYKVVPFVSLDIDAATVEESNPASLLTVPVRLYNAGNTACTVTYTVTDVNAVQGTDYTLLDNSGVLEFKAGEDSLAIQFNITGQPGTFTGNVAFDIELVSASNDVELGNTCVAEITIKDLDHPLSALFGAYTMKAVTYNGSNLVYPSWTMNMSAYDGDPTRVWMDNLTAFTVAYGNYTGAAPTFGIVSADKKTITIPLPQKTKGDLSAFGFDNVWMMAHEGYGGGAGVYITDGTNIVFTQGADGTWSTTQSFGAGHPDDLAEWPKLFTDYCVNYADVSAANPICFVKK